MATLTIGRLAERVGISVETIRYYERRRLLKQPTRPASGYRRYGEDAVRRLAFIRRAKALGFTLSEVQDLLELNTGSGSPCSEVEETTGRTVARIEEQIGQLTRIKKALGLLVAKCRSGEDPGECPILEALEEAE
ncbi:MAG: MerR family DNA-binding protein [Gemmatimonadota bacterium]